MSILSHLEGSSLNDPDVSRYSVTKLDFNDITDGELISLDGDLLSFSQAKSILGHKVLEGFHDL